MTFIVFNSRTEKIKIIFFFSTGIKIKKVWWIICANHQTHDKNSDNSQYYHCDNKAIISKPLRECYTPC